MKTATGKLAPAVIGILCLTLANAARAGDDSKVPETSAGQRMDSEMKPGESAPAKYNKASGILGMDVRNQSDEHLGHIKDVVFDWKTERVSYAVISTAPKAVLGIGEKLLAVPLSALTVGPSGKNLVLNADKSKIEAAMGFDRNNWPSVSSPSWGAQPFWQEGTGTSGEAAKPSTEDESTPKSDINSESKTESEEESQPNMEPEPKPETDPEAAPNTETESTSEMEGDSEPDL